MKHGHSSVGFIVGVVDGIEVTGTPVGSSVVGMIVGVVEGRQLGVTEGVIVGAVVGPALQWQRMRTSL
jgi:hypothetical protein